MKAIDRAITLWGIQDGLLQSYRGFFLTAISIFAAMALALIQAHDKSFLGYFVSFVGIYVNVLWIELTWRRGWWVHYLQTLIRDAEAIEAKGGPEPPADIFTQLRRYQREKKFADAEHKTRDMIGSGRSRSGLSFGLPFLFMIFWLAQTVYSGAQTCGANAGVMPLLAWTSLAFGAVIFTSHFVYVAVSNARRIDLWFWLTMLFSAVVVLAGYFWTPLGSQFLASLRGMCS